MNRTTIAGVLRCFHVYIGESGQCGQQYAELIALILKFTPLLAARTANSSGYFHMPTETFREFLHQRLR